MEQNLKNDRLEQLNQILATKRSLGGQTFSTLSQIRNRLSALRNIDYILSEETHYILSGSREGLSFDFHAETIKAAQYNSYILALFKEYGIFDNTLGACITSYKGNIEFNYFSSSYGLYSPFTLHTIDFSGGTTTEIILTIIEIVGTVGIEK